MSMKKSNDTIGNQTRDLPLVALCLNQLRHRVPQMWLITKPYFVRSDTYQLLLVVSCLLNSALFADTQKDIWIINLKHAVFCFKILSWLFT
jgi:hypothetical protein